MISRPQGPQLQYTIVVKRARNITFKPNDHPLGIQFTVLSIVIQSTDQLTLFPLQSHHPFHHGVMPRLSGTVVDPLSYTSYRESYYMRKFNFQSYLSCFSQASVATVESRSRLLWMPGGPCTQSRPSCISPKKQRSPIRSNDSSPSASPPAVNSPVSRRP